MWISENDPNQYVGYGNEMPANKDNNNGMAYPEMAMYPSIYYILQPHVLVVCDQMEMCGCMMPHPHMMMHMCDQVCDRVMKMHPEMAQYDAPYPTGMMPDPPFGTEQYDRFRRRTPIRDLAFFLLLAEIFRRRRRVY